MKRPIGGPRAAALLFICLGLMPGVSAQTPAAAPPPDSPPEPRQERLAIGIRVRLFPTGTLGVMGDKHYMDTTTAPVYDWNFNTTSRSPVVGAGAGFDVRLSRKTSLRTELLFHRLRYDKVTDIVWGTDNSLTGNDERSRMVRTERTKARLWDLPVMLQYHGLGPEGVLSRMYFSVGAVARTISTIRTNHETAFPNGDKVTNTFTVQPSRRNILGASVGIGFRIVDDYNMKTTPEIRYTRWGGSTFGSDSTQSPRNQLEIGIGFMF